MNKYKKLMQSSSTISIIIAALLASPLSMAQEKQGMELNIQAHEEITVTNEDGSIVTSYIAPDSVVPGDYVVYTVSYTNHGPDPATDVVISNPISPHLLYQPGSAEKEGVEVKFSVDGGKQFKPATELTVLRDGEEIPATEDDYTNIQWQFTFAIEPRSSGELHYKVKLK